MVTQKIYMCDLSDILVLVSSRIAKYVFRGAKLLQIIFRIQSKYYFAVKELNKLKFKNKSVNS